MNSEVFEALALLEKERGIPVDFMLDKIRKAIITACKNSYGNEDAVVNVDEKKGEFEVFLRKTVVEEVTDSGKEISLEKAREIDPLISYGEKVSIPLNTKDFGRIAAQTARNIIRQGIRSGEIRFSYPEELAEIVLIVLTVKIDNTLVPSTKEEIENTINALISLLEKGTDNPAGSLNFLKSRLS